MINKVKSLAELLTVLEFRLLETGDSVALDLLQDIKPMIPEISIDNRQDYGSIFDTPRRAYLENVRMPRVTIRHGNVTYTMENPIIVSLDLEHGR